VTGIHIQDSTTDTSSCVKVSKQRNKLLNVSTNSTPRFAKI